MNLDVVLFQLFPYVAVFIMVFESIRRYVQRRFSYSSLSSQFLEGNQLFAGSVPWHYGILWVLTGHLVAFLFPRELLAFNSVPVRLFILEISALVGGLLALIGIANLCVRRLRNSRVRAVTTTMDIVILVVLLAQTGLGVYIATSLRWGSNWYAIVMVPYLRSLLAFQPDIATVAVLPLAVKAHILGAFIFFALLPFSRLVHLLVPPLQYLRRPPQVVIWNRDPRRRNLPVTTVSAGPGKED